jgi:adenylate cyclase, class 2
MEALPYKDVTIKARLINAEEIEKIIQEQNSQFIGLDIQTDHYFLVSKGKLKFRKGVIENLIAHYERVASNGLEKTIVYRYERNPSQEQIEELFRKHKLIGKTRKVRKIYRIDNIKIHIDLLPGGDNFIEIEAIDKDNTFSMNELSAQCLEMKSVLGLPDNALIKTGYFNNLSDNTIAPGIETAT